MIPKINSSHGSETRNIINRVIDVLNQQGKSLQDLVAEGQLTEEQYAELLTTINSLVKSGNVDKSDLTPEFKGEIEGLNTQLAEKPTYSETRLKAEKLNPEDLSEETLGLVTGTGTVNVLSIPQPESVTKSRYKGAYTVGKNLFDKNEVIFGYYIPSATGIPVAGTSSTGLNCCTDFIEIEQNTNYYRNSRSNVFFYDVNKAYLSNTSTAENYPFTTPSNAKYLRITMVDTDINVMQLEKGTTGTSYEEHKFTVMGLRDADSVDGLNTFKEYLGNTFEFELGSLSSASGTETTASSRIRTVKEKEFGNNDTIYLKDKINYNMNIVIYDLTGVFIKTTGWIVNDYTFDGNYLARILVSKADLSDLTNVIQETASQVYSFSPTKSLQEQNKKEFISSLNTNIDGGREALFGFNVEVDGSYLSDFTFVGDELWVFPVSNDENTNYVNVSRYTVDTTNKNHTLVGQFKHNWGHVNSVDYSPEKDTLIFGNGSGNYNLPGVIYLIENASNLKNLTQADINDVAIKIDCSNYGLGSKFNLCWGESNRGQYNIAYLITDDHATIRKILLGLGTNQLEMGQFIEGKGWNRFNGTFKILNEYHQNVVRGDEVNQGSDYDRGVLYTGVGHDGVWYWENYLQEDGSIVRKSFKEYPYSPEGNKWSSGTQGICVSDEYLLVGDSGGIFIQKR